jgi:hypothetical protein
MIRRVFVDDRVFGEDQPKVRTHHTPFSVEDIKSATEEGRRAERERIIALLTDTYGEDYVDMGVVGQVVALIRGDKET